MKYEFLPHARKRMAERTISRKLVIDALRFPTKISSNRQGRQLIKKLYTGKRGVKRLLLVVIEVASDVIRIITVIDTSKVGKYL